MQILCYTMCLPSYRHTTFPTQILRKLLILLKIALYIGFLPHLSPLGVTLRPVCSFPGPVDARIHRHITLCWIRHYVEP